MSEAEQQEVLRRRDAGGLKYIDFPCGKCGCVLRYARTKKCVDCVLHAGKQHRAQKLVKRAPTLQPGTPLNGTQDRACRAYAASVGEPTYRGVACKSCHEHERYTSNGKCVECVRRRNSRQYAERVGDPLLVMFG